MRQMLALLLAATLPAVTVSGCAGSSPPAVMAPQGRPGLTPAEQAAADGGIPPYTEADVEFMSGMIPHHAQAVLMAGWAGANGASATLQALTERIVVAQRDEIGFMQRWLRERGRPVPEGDAAHDMMPGMDHRRLMPGMLTADELQRLHRARGLEYDRLFLEYMIRHHEGALVMVDRLLSSPGAAHDDDVFKFAADVHADQTTEIERMKTMLAALPAGPAR